MHRKKMKQDLFYNKILYKRGTSLLELLIYIALMAGLMVVVSDAFLSLSKGRGRSEARSEVSAAIRFATEKIRQDVKGASAVTVPTAPGTASSTLNLTVGGAAIVYNISGGQLMRTAGASSSAITGAAVTVSAPTFTRLENYNTVFTATTTSIQVSMTIGYNSTSTDWAYSESLRTSADLR